MARRAAVTALLLFAATPRSASAEDTPLERFELGLSAGYGFLAGAAYDYPPGNPFGAALGIRASAYVGQRRALWLGARCIRSFGSTTSRETSGYALDAHNQPVPIVYETDIHYRILDCTAEIGGGYRTPSLLFRGYGSLGLALDSQCDTIRGDAKAVLGDFPENPRCSPGGGLAIGGGALGMARMVSHLWIGIDTRLLSASMPEGCAEACVGGARTTIGVSAVGAVTFLRRRRSRLEPLPNRSSSCGERTVDVFLPTPLRRARGCPPLHRELLVAIRQDRLELHTQTASVASASRSDPPLEALPFALDLP